MRQSSGEAIININELNRILPSYLLNEVEEDNKSHNNIGETKINSIKREGYGETQYSNGKKEKGIYINDALIYRKNN